MELALYIADLARLLDVEQTLRFVDHREIPTEVSAVLSLGDVGMREYLGNLAGIEWLESFCAQGAEVSRLYFGQEFCEHLIPRVDELETAYYFARQVGWDFTYMTGCVTDAGLDQVLANLEFVAAQTPAAEVVVNDWGVLSVLAREFPGLQPVLGRLLVKQMRLARFTGNEASPPPISLNGLETSEKDIRTNQIRALRGLNLTVPEYRQELARLGVRRIDIDMAPQGVELPADKWGFAVGCYFPWGYVCGGRNCLTAGTVDPAREFVVVDKPCPRPCREVNKVSQRLHLKETMAQRGNTVFVLHTESATAYLEGESAVDRIVFEPYIPLS